MYINKNLPKWLYKPYYILYNMKCVKSSLKHAEEVKKEILSLGILSHKYKIVKDKYYVYFPITQRISGFEIVEKKLPKKIVRLSFEEVLRKKFTKEYSKVYITILVNFY